VMDRCCMCRNSGESIDLLLLYFGVPTKLSVSVFCLVGVEWVMPNRWTYWLVELASLIVTIIWRPGGWLPIA
jgi:hypothetical protein